jgi:hypothetical protein
MWYVVETYHSKPLQLFGPASYEDCIGRAIDLIRKRRILKDETIEELRKNNYCWTNQKSFARVTIMEAKDI